MGPQTIRGITSPVVYLWGSGPMEKSARSEGWQAKVEEKKRPILSDFSPKESVHNRFLFFSTTSFDLDSEWQC